MLFKIIGDSCCDFTKDDLKKEYFCKVPLTLNVGGIDVLDDESFEQGKFLEMMDATDECPKSACPSPEAFMSEFIGAENIYVVTLSSGLSGSYNSAMIAKDMYLEENPNVKIHVFDSKSAAGGEHLICEKIEEMALRGVAFEDIIKTTNEFISKLQTLFVLDNLEILRKNGRLTKVKAAVANVLNIKPVLGVLEGEIQQIDQARGMKKALSKLVEQIEKLSYDKSRKVIISQCDSKDICLKIKNVLIDKLGFQNVDILDAGGVTTMYENKGGVIISFQVI